MVLTLNDRVVEISSGKEGIVFETNRMNVSKVVCITFDDINYPTNGNNIKVFFGTTIDTQLTKL